MGFKKGYTPWNKGLTIATDERIIKLGVQNKGKHPVSEFKKGQTFSKERNDKISRTLKEGYTNGKYNSWIIGKTHSDKTKANMSKNRKGKSLEEMYGIDKAKQIKIRLRLSKIGNKYTKGYKHSEENKKLMSLSHLKEKNQLGHSS